MDGNVAVEHPKPTLSVADAVAVVVGMVIGAGIFALPKLVAFNVPGPMAFILVWVAGGVISLIGALCYAELASTYPDVGGDYHFLCRAYGGGVGFLFAWARLAVIQTGSIALQAFIVGDYAAQLFSFGPYSAAAYAALVVLVLTGLNILGVHFGAWMQNVLAVCEVAGLLLIVAVGGYLALKGGPATDATDAAASGGAAGFGPLVSSIGMAMVFVLLTYGGWNEAAYLTAELKGGRRAILRVLLWGIGIVTAVYLLVNLAYLSVLGMGGIKGSSALAADAMRPAFGDWGARVLSLMVVIAALSTTNATIITGARTNYALGRDFPMFRFLGRWRPYAETPANALMVQGAISLALVAFGALYKGFETMVNYTAPVFWLFFLLAGLSLIVLRQRHPGADRPFRVPLYPVTPLLFSAVCVYMLWSSLNYHRLGALVGVGVLAAGVPLMLLARAWQPPVAGRADRPPGFDVAVPAAEGE